MVTSRTSVTRIGLFIVLTTYGFIHFGLELVRSFVLWDTGRDLFNVRELLVLWI